MSRKYYNHQPVHSRFFSVLAFTLALVGVPFCVSAAIPAFAYDDAVENLQSAGIVDSGDARVMQHLNRAEALKILLANQPSAAAEIRRVQAQMPPVALFSDVDQSAWYAPYIEVGFARGMVRGYPDGTFRPGTSLSVAEAAALLVRSYGQQSSVEYRTSPDLPNVPGAWYASSFSTLIERDAVMPTSKLSAAAPITRGQLMDMVYRMRIAHGVTTVAALPSPTITTSAPVAAATVRPSTKAFAISIPSIGLADLPVSHPQDTSTQKGILAPLSSGVGHLLGYPGDGGKVMIYGHSSDYPWKISQFSEIFSTINRTEIGDPIYVTHNGTLHEYRVTEKLTIPAKDRSIFEPDDNGEELILYTCWPVGSISSRYIVIARPVGSVAKR